MERCRAGPGAGCEHGLKGCVGGDKVARKWAVAGRQLQSTALHASLLPGLGASEAAGILHRAVVQKMPSTIPPSRRHGVGFSGGGTNTTNRCCEQDLEKSRLGSPATCPSGRSTVGTCVTERCAKHSCKQKGPSRTRKRHVALAISPAGLQRPRRCALAPREQGLQLPLRCATG